ncbi:hypothetical protein ACWCL1_04300 [Ligilactobacillus sp. LYQ135]
MIANINAYARVMTKNWLKQGLTTPEMVEESMRSKGVTIVTGVITQYSWKICHLGMLNCNNNSTNKQAVLTDIERLKAKLDC